MALNDTTNYLDAMDSLVSNYNDTRNKGIDSQTPNDVNASAPKTSAKAW
jgi:hypothetical protein